MKTNIQFTGTNIAAAAMLLTYFFFTWVSASIVSFTGFDITMKAISPGIYASTFTGLSRLSLIALLLIPVSAGLILFQNVSGDLRFAKFFRVAHLVPAVLLIALLAGSYLKLQSLQSDVSSAMGGFGAYASMVKIPGLFDILGIGTYVCLAASIVLALIGTGRMKDKVYYSTGASNSSETTDNNSTTSNQQ